MGRINETLLILGFQGWVLQVTCLSLWFWTAGLGTRRGWAPKADPIPRFKSVVALPLTVRVLSPLGLGGKAQTGIRPSSNSWFSGFPHFAHGAVN